MKLSIIIPILSAGANKQNENKKGSRSVERFVASEVTNDCSEQVPAKGGIFLTSGNGSNGEINLEKYPTNINCKHVVQASSSCTEIQIQLRSVVTELYCFDFFRFGWTGTNGSFDITPARCSCFGDGCHYEKVDYEDYSYSYFSHYVESGQVAEWIGPDSLTVDSNMFTFYFRSDAYNSLEDSHIIFDWECVKYSTTTTTTATTTTTSKTTSTTPM